ncbi:MAG: putative bifunctional transcriptional activator/DNA repair enzyme AlkA [Pseudomonas fluorescens]|nr:MAG: putative bifunctional transcriptional activator/DNA repair enzyme AlkA [Pseudomonas fluorescens]
MRLEYQPPYDWAAMSAFLALRAITGLETLNADGYRRSIALGENAGWIGVTPGAGNWLDVTVDFPDPHALPEIERRLRKLFDLDADPLAINRQLASDPLMARLVAARPGLRVPGAWDGLELAIRAVLGQQITVVAAIRLAGKLVAQYGQPLETPHAGITHTFPTAGVLVAADLAALGMPKARGRTLSGIAQASLDDPLLFTPKASLKDSVARLVALPGIGDWTAQYIALRHMREPDAFASGDIVLINALAALEGGPVSPRQLLARAEAWRPLRAYAAQHLWTAL